MPCLIIGFSSIITTCIICRFRSCCWITLVQAGGSAGWEIRVKGDLTPRADNGKINSSPTTAVSPIFRLRHGGTHIINIPGKEL